MASANYLKSLDVESLHTDCLLQRRYEVKNTLVIGVLALIVTASADTYYWNPTTTPGAAGEANWSRTAAAWSDSSSGTSSPVVWPTWSDAVFQTYDGLNTVNATEDIGADSLSILGGTYMFTGNKTIKVHSPGLRVVDSTVTVSNIISVTESKIGRAHV